MCSNKSAAYASHSMRKRKALLLSLVYDADAAVNAQCPNVFKLTENAKNGSVINTKKIDVC